MSKTDRSAAQRRASRRTSGTTRKADTASPGSKATTRKPSGAARKKASGSRKDSPRLATRARGKSSRATAKSSSSRSQKSTSRSQKSTSGRKAKRGGKAATRPIVRDESAVLLQLENLLRTRIVGKEEAIGRVANTIRIRRTNLDFKPHRPDGSFLIVGPPGVGKSEFANAVAEVLLGNEGSVINLDMADYTMEEDIEDLLVTAYPGVEGVLVEGALTTPVRSNPRSIILFRGLERAHPAVQRLMLHVLERGQITDAQGEVSFNQTIVFATTRLDTDEAEMVEQIGFTRSAVPREERCRKMLDEQFSPELVGAFNEVLYFNSLTPQDVKLIARYKVNSVLKRLKQQKRGVTVSDRVYDTFIKESEVRQAGARYLNRALEEKLFTPLSKYLLEHAKARSNTVDVQDDKLVIHTAS